MNEWMVGMGNYIGCLRIYIFVKVSRLIGCQPFCCVLCACDEMNTTYIILPFSRFSEEEVCWDYKIE